MKLHSYPKVYAIGHKQLEFLFDGPVIIQEKVDGSQINFGVLNGKLCVQSKSKDQSPNSGTDSMFELAVRNIQEIEKALMPEFIYRGEYLSKPKHNALAYSQIPNKNIVLFDINDGDESYLTPIALVGEAARLGLDCVPLLYTGEIDNQEQIKSLLNTQSFLGGVKVEGVVVKNYSRYGADGKALMGKFVSEEFKEKHALGWKHSNPGGKDIITQLGDSYKNEARWKKAVQHLEEKGELNNDPSDIGPLMKELHQDLLVEEQETIKEVLFNWAWKNINRGAVRGFPEWYKEQLLKGAFEKTN